MRKWGPAEGDAATRASLAVPEPGRVAAHSPPAAAGSTLHPSRPFSEVVLLHFLFLLHFGTWIHLTESTPIWRDVNYVNFHEEL